MKPKRTLLLAAMLPFLIVMACRDDPVRICPANGCHGIGPPIYPAIDSEMLLIEALRLSYQKRDYTAFASLLANDSTENAVFDFKFGSPLPTGGDHCGLAEELCLHRRMFNPENPDPGQPLLPTDLWLQSISISLNPQADFVERSDLYRSNLNPNGLDANRFKAASAVYAADIFFKTSGAISYQVNGEAKFVVLMDKRKSGSEAGRFRILAWEELAVTNAGIPTVVTPHSWGEIKRLYGCR